MWLTQLALPWTLRTPRRTISRAWRVLSRESACLGTRVRWRAASGRTWGVLISRGRVLSCGTVNARCRKGWRRGAMLTSQGTVPRCGRVARRARCGNGWRRGAMQPHPRHPSRHGRSPRRLGALAAHRPKPPLTGRRACLITCPWRRACLITWGRLPDSAREEQPHTNLQEHLIT